MSPELKEFLTGIATDPDRATRYADDPEAAMEDANLPEDDRETLRKTHPDKLGEMVPDLIMQMTGSPPDPQA